MVHVPPMFLDSPTTKLSVFIFFLVVFRADQARNPRREILLKPGDRPICDWNEACMLGLGPVHASEAR